MNSLSRIAGVLALAAASACDFSKPDIDSVPAQPTFTRDILPIFNDHCNFCHGEQPARGAEGEFRLDVYDDVDGVWGAKRMAGESYGTVQEDEMPPSAAWGDGLGPNAKEALRLWVSQGTPR